MTAIVKSNAKTTVAIQRALLWEHAATPLFSYKLFLVAPAGLSVPATPPVSQVLCMSGDD